MCIFFSSEAGSWRVNSVFDLLSSVGLFDHIGLRNDNRNVVYYVQHSRKSMICCLSTSTRKQMIHERISVKNTQGTSGSSTSSESVARGG